MIRVPILIEAHSRLSAYFIICVEVITRHRMGITYITAMHMPLSFTPLAMVIAMLQGKYLHISENLCLFVFCIISTAAMLLNLLQAFINRNNTEPNYIHSLSTGEPRIKLGNMNILLIRRILEPTLWLVTGLLVGTFTSETTFSAVLVWFAIAVFLKEQKIRVQNEAFYQAIGDESQTAETMKGKMGVFKGEAHAGFYDVE